MEPTVDTSTHRLCVIVAEDDEAFREVLVERFRAEGYDVLEVGEGRSLLAMLESALSGSDPHAIDVVVCDHRLPRMTGLRALRRLRGWDHKVPFVLITAFCDEQVRQGARQWGADCVLSKPFEIDRLVDVVGRLVSVGAF